MLLATFLVVTTGLAWVASYPTHGLDYAWRVGGGLVSAVANVATYLVAFRVLTPGGVKLRQLIP